MKPDELANKIAFTEYAITKDEIALEAFVEIRAGMHYSKLSHERLDNPERCQHKDQMRQQLREQILRHIYTDNRDALYPAIMDLMKCEPYDFKGIQQAKDKIIKLARTW